MLIVSGVALVVMQVLLALIDTSWLQVTVAAEIVHPLKGVPASGEDAPTLMLTHAADANPESISETEPTIRQRKKRMLKGMC